MDELENKNIKLDKSLKLIAKSSFIVFIGLILSKALAWVYRLIIARFPEVSNSTATFGTETYGLFSLSVLIINFIAALFSLGIAGGVLRYVSLYRGEKNFKKINYIVRFSLLISLITGIFAVVLLFLSSKYISLNIFHNPELIPYLRWMSLTVPLTIILGILVSIIQAYEKINWYSFIRNILDNGVKVGILALFILPLGLKINGIIFSYILGVLAMFVVSLYVCSYKISGVFGKHDMTKKDKKEINKSFIKYSWPLILASMIIFLFSTTDSFVIGYLRNVSDVGIYNAAVPIASLLMIAPALFLQLLFPLITKEYATKNHGLVREISKQVGKWIFLINLPLFIILILFPGAMINLLFGAEYIGASNSLRYLAIGTFFYSIFIVSENLLSMAGKSKIVLFNLGITALINLILDIILVKFIGIDGAAITTMVVYVIWSLITILQARKHTSVIPLKRKMLLILAIAMIPTFLLLIIKRFTPINFITLIIQGVLFLLIYFLLIALFRAFDRNDIMIISSIKNKFSNNLTFKRK